MIYVHFSGDKLQDLEACSLIQREISSTGFSHWTETNISR